MIRWRLAGIVVAVVLASFSTYAGAAAWTKLGSSGFTTTPTSMRDFNRIRFNSIAFDGAGNIYATACNLNNNGTSGGLTIFQPDGTKIADVDLNALGFAGAVTKLVTGGDGVVYGLQNWVEIGWKYAQNVNRILAIAPNGNVVEIWNAGLQSDANRITGMTVGGDGNIYWTMNGADSYWKTHFLWRYDVAGGFVEGALPGTNIGWAETTRMFNLAYVGASPTTWDLGHVSSGSSNWGLDALSWTLGRQDNPENDCNPGWGRDWITALVWDPVDDILWAGGRGGGSGPWSYSGGGGTTTLANGEITMSKVSGGSTYYRLNLPEFNGPDAVTAVSIASRFKVTAFSPDYDGTIVHIRPVGDHPEAKIVVAAGNYVLRDRNGVLATLAPVVVGEYNEAYVAVDQTTDKVECWWNGTKMYDGAAALETYYGWSAAMFGASVRDGTYAGTATVVLDWVAANTRRLAPGDPMPTQLAYYLDGNGTPDFYASTNIMSYWPGSADPGFWPPGPCFSWHANGNDPNVSQIANGGRYWVSAIATNPANGEAWMAWNGEPTYHYDPLGAVWTRNAVPSGISTLGYEGVPEAGAQTVAVGFYGGKVYATTCNVTTGGYSVYSKTPGPQVMSIGEAKQSYPGSFAATNAPKLVTFPAADDDTTTYFYIEEDDRRSGIKVIPEAGQPVAKLGQKALVEGRTGVREGEAVIFASSVVVTDAGEAAIKPLAMNGRSVGGLQLGIQPVTLRGGSEAYEWPDNLNTTGLLIRVAGKLRRDAYMQAYVDDGSEFPIRIQYEPGVPGSDGDTVIVTGVSGVAWDGANGFRVILLRKDTDVRILP